MRTPLLAGVPAAALAPVLVHATVVYEETFDGAASEPAGYSSSGHYSGSGLDVNTGNGTPLLYLETDHETSIFFDSSQSKSPVSFRAGDLISFEFDLLGASSNDPADLTETPLRVSFFKLGEAEPFAAEDYLAEGTDTNFSAVVWEPGRLGIGFTTVRTASGYGQIELDNFSVEVIRVPEPASLALVGLGGLLLTRRR